MKGSSADRYENPSETPSETKGPFRNSSETLLRSGGSEAGNESLECKFKTGFKPPTFATAFLSFSVLTKHMQIDSWCAQALTIAGSQALWRMASGRFWVDLGALRVSVGGCLGGCFLGVGAVSCAFSGNFQRERQCSARSKICTLVVSSDFHVGCSLGPLQWILCTRVGVGKSGNRFPALSKT